MLSRMSGEDFERDWRAGVVRAQDETSRALQQAAVTLERVNGRLDNHESRIKIIEERPERRAESRNRETLTICAVVGVIVALATMCGGALNAVVVVGLHFLR